MADAGMMQVREAPEKPSETEEALASVAADDLALDASKKRKRKTTTRSNRRPGVIGVRTRWAWR
jgi:hypothetical protein